MSLLVLVAVAFISTPLIGDARGAGLDSDLLGCCSILYGSWILRQKTGISTNLGRAVTQEAKLAPGIELKEYSW